MIALIALQISQSEITADRAERTILPVVAFEQIEVREAIRTLFRQGQFGGTIATAVQGRVTANLRRVPFSQALQLVLRQVDATYRIEHGFFEIVRREETNYSSFQEPDPREAVLRERYEAIAKAIAAGKGTEVRSSIGPRFEVMTGGLEAQTGQQAIRSFIESFRAYPQYAIEGFTWSGTSVQNAEVVVRYQRAGSPSRYFLDLWQKFPNGPWQLSEREESSLLPSLKFVDVPLWVVLTKAFRRGGVSWTVDPKVDRNRLVTVDLTGLPLESALMRLTEVWGLNYRLEAGVYQILPGHRP